MELGETSGKITNASRWEMWLWNQEVQDKLKDKRKAKKVWDTIEDDASKLANKNARKQDREKWQRQKKGIRGTARKIGNKGGVK